MAVNQLKAGAVLSYVLIGLNVLIGLLYTPFLLRMLGQSEYGLYSLAASVIAYLTVLDLGFGNAIIRYTAKFRAEGKTEEQYEMFGMFFLLYLVISLVAFGLAIFLAFNTDVIFSAKMTATEVARLRIILILMAFNLAFTLPMSIWGSIITAYEDFVFQKLINIARTILNPLIMIVLLYMGYKAIALVVVTTICNVLTLCINQIYCKRKLHIKLYFRKFKWGFLKEVSIYSFWIFLNAIMDRLYWSTGQFVLGIYKGTASVAIYAVAIQLKDMFFMFSTAISSVFLPRVTSMVTKGASEKELTDLFIKTGRIQYLIMAFVLVAFILFGQSFISLWAGHSYLGAYSISLLFFIASMIPLIQNLGITILMARNQMKFRSIVYVIIAIGSVFLSIPLAKTYDGIGCAIATSLALLLGQGLIMNLYYRYIIHLDIGRFWREIGKMSIAPILVGGLGYVILRQIEMDNLYMFLLSTMIFCIIYFIVVWRIGMNAYERNLFKAPIVKLLAKF